MTVRTCSTWKATTHSSLLAQRGRLRHYRSLANRVRRSFELLTHESDAALQLRARELRWSLQSGADVDQLIVPVMSLTCAWMQRIYGLKPHLVQIIGGVTMIFGGIAEMQTGEGKTLTALFPVVLRALVGKGCHVLTVNDYLAARDAEFATPLLRAFGLRVAAITNAVERKDRAACYAADVTYGTEKEFGFDFLKDQLVRSAQRQASASGSPMPDLGPLVGVVQRDPYFALVDEADSVLIDQARTPLIIALPQPHTSEELALFHWCHRTAAGLQEKRDYQYQPQTRSVSLTVAGCQRVMLAVRPLEIRQIQIDQLYRQVERALLARHGFEVDRDFVIVNGKVEIVDEGTGRVLAGRKWRDGLQQAIEIQAGAELSDPTGTAARITLQSYLAKYPHLCGMTGTTANVRQELMRVYGTPVTSVPTHRPCLRKGQPTRIFRTFVAKMDAIAETVAQSLQQQRAVLVGTSSVAASEECGRVLRCRGIEAEILHARHHQRESEIVAQAGKAGRVTVATNMAGRGTDIKITPEVHAAGGLHVICTEMNRSARIDRQLIGRTARQGDPGSFQLFVSLEDPLLEVLGEQLWTRLRAKAATYRRDELPRSWLFWFHKAQSRLERIDAHDRRLLIRDERKRREAFEQFGFDPTVDFLEEMSG